MARKGVGSGGGGNGMLPGRVGGGEGWIRGWLLAWTPPDPCDYNSPGAGRGALERLGKLWSSPGGSLWRVEVSLEVDPSSPDGVCVVKINGPADLTTFRTINRGMRLFRMLGCPSDIRMGSHAHGRPDRPWTARKDLNFRAVRICGSPTGWSGRLGPFT